MVFRLLMAGLVTVVLAAPALYAQSRTGGDEVRVQLPRSGRLSMIGVRLSDVTEETAKMAKLSKPEGAVVESVNPNSPAATAGLREKDVIVQFDGERVRSATHLTRLVGETPADREVVVSVMRDGRRVDLRVKPEAGTTWFDPRFGGTIEFDSDELREQMKQAGEAVRELRRNMPEVMEDVREGVISSNRARLGVSVQEVSGDLAAYFGVRAGVLVTSVVAESAAAKAGLRVGDVITAVNDKPVTTPRELVNALPAGDGPYDAALTVTRDKKEMVVRVTLSPPPSPVRPARGRRV